MRCVSTLTPRSGQEGDESILAAWVEAIQAVMLYWFSLSLSLVDDELGLMGARH